MSESRPGRVAEMRAERDKDRELFERMMEQWFESFCTHLGNDGWEWHPANTTLGSLEQKVPRG
jgi:hypothetical protein